MRSHVTRNDPSFLPLAVPSEVNRKKGTIIDENEKKKKKTIYTCNEKNMRVNRALHIKGRNVIAAYYARKTMVRSPLGGEGESLRQPNIPECCRATGL